MKRSAAFLDRDGTINANPPQHAYVTRPEEMRLLPGAIDGIAALAGCGYVPVVVTNQRGIGRGLLSEGELESVNGVIAAALAAGGVTIAGFYHCPHLIEDGCDCRKPAPGMLLQAAEELDLDLASSWMVGDAPSDIGAGAASGCRTAYIGEGPAEGATITASSLGDAARSICAAGGR